MWKRTAPHLWFDTDAVDAANVDASAAIDEMLRTGTKEIGRVAEAFLQMKKFDLAELRRAYADR
jgi:predicted 3-demethylubiquinone-9 3-methyltransferase (glyoxalase superfamily)